MYIHTCNTFIPQIKGPEYDTLLHVHSITVVQLPNGMWYNFSKWIHNEPGGTFLNSFQFVYIFYAMRSPDRCWIVKDWLDKVVIGINFNLTMAFSQVSSDERQNRIGFLAYAIYMDVKVLFSMYAATQSMHRYSYRIRTSIIWRGKLSRLRTLCFAANPETIHTCGSSVYSVLELEESRFTRSPCRRDKRIRNWQFCPRLLCVPRENWTPVIWFVRRKRETEKFSIVKFAVSKNLWKPESFPPRIIWDVYGIHYKVSI